jgi:tetratricopeptide (TPR) repeat protein
MDSKYLREREEFLSFANKDLEKGNYGKALVLANERIARFPGDVDAWLVVAACLVRMGKYKKAEKILQELNQILPGWSQIRECLGDVCVKMRMDEEAIGYYKSALTPDPPMVERIKEKIESIEGGKEKGSEAEIGGISSDFQTVTLADLYLKQGHVETAVGVLQNILRRDPENKEARERLKYATALLEGNKESMVIKKLNGWLQNLRTRKNGGG